MAKIPSWDCPVVLLNKHLIYQMFVKKQAQDFWSCALFMP